MERRFTTSINEPVICRDDSTDSLGKIEGRAIVFYDGSPGTEYLLYQSQDERIVERVMSGAVTRAINESQDVCGLFNHDPNLILGRTTAGTLKLTLDSRGLMYEIDAGKTSVAADVREHIRRKDIKGSSFAFRAKEQTWARDTGDPATIVREIRDIDLFDVSPCTFPAYGSTSTSVRSAGAEDVEKLIAEARAFIGNSQGANAIEAIIRRHKLALLK